MRLLIAGLLTRVIAVPFILEMLVAMLSTKISLYLGTSPLPLPPVAPQSGLWAVLHEIRSEYAQLMVTIFLLSAGPGTGLNLTGRGDRAAISSGFHAAVDTLSSHDLQQEVRDCQEQQTTARQSRLSASYPRTTASCSGD